MLTALIIDDESKVRDTLEQMLLLYCPNIQVIGQANGVESGFEAIKKLNPDVVFLDMQMNDGNGFDLLRRFSAINFQLIIVTAYQEYAIKAFRYSALDYLLKPIDSNDLIIAIEKLTKNFNQSETKSKFDVLLSNSQNKDSNHRKLALKTIDGIHIVDTQEIIRCESHNNTTEFILVNSEPVKVSKTLKEYEELLSDCGFIRCHQSHLINRNYITQLSKFPIAEITMTDGSVIPIAIRKKDIIDLIERNR